MQSKENKNFSKNFIKDLFVPWSDWIHQMIYIMLCNLCVWKRKGNIKITILIKWWIWPENIEIKPGRSTYLNWNEYWSKLFEIIAIKHIFDTTKASFYDETFWMFLLPNIYIYVWGVLIKHNYASATYNSLTEF